MDTKQYLDVWIWIQNWVSTKPNTMHHNSAVSLSREFCSNHTQLEQDELSCSYCVLVSAGNHKLFRMTVCLQTPHSSFFYLSCWPSSNGFQMQLVGIPSCFMMKRRTGPNKFAPKNVSPVVENNCFSFHILHFTHTHLTH